jgi:serine protease Do
LKKANNMRLKLISFVTSILLASNVFALESFAPVVEKALPAVVNISTTQKIKAGGSLNLPDMQLDKQQQLEEFLKRFGFPMQGLEGAEREVNSLGSGFVIDPLGYVVTNNHVIAEATQITVTFANDKKLEAKVVGRDAKTDLALLKVDSKEPLPFVQFGDSEKMRVGDWVIAIGNPFGLGSTVTAGIISARSRNINAGPFDDFIQTDAAINRGNSGGPMFNQNGEVIGVNTAIFSPSGGSVGIGFAIPTELAKPVLDQLKLHGRAYRGWLGVKIQHVTEEIADSLGLAEPTGALVLEISKDSPAAGSGLQNGDVILQFDGKPVKEMRNLPRLVAETPIGSEVELEIWRDGSAKIISLKLGEYPEEESAISQAPKAKPENQKGEKILSMNLLTLDASEASRISGAEKLRGVLILGVDEASEAAKRSIKAGDIILGINQIDIKNLNELKAEIGKAKAAKRDYALVRIWRDGDSSYITLPIDEN